jgi:hypothetical protein
MAHQFLQRADVIAVLHQVGCEAVPQRMAARGLGQVRLTDRLLDGPPHHLLVQVLARTRLLGLGQEALRSQKNVLPAPTGRCGRCFSIQRRRHRHSRLVSPLLPEELGMWNG